MMSERFRMRAALVRFWSSTMIRRSASLLEIFLEGEGHRAAAASDGIAALDLVARGVIHPDLILADLQFTQRPERASACRTTSGETSSFGPGHHSDRRYLDRYLA